MNFTYTKFAAVCSHIFAIPLGLQGSRKWIKRYTAKVLIVLLGCVVFQNEGFAQDEDKFLANLARAQYIGDAIQTVLKNRTVNKRDIAIANAELQAVIRDLAGPDNRLALFPEGGSLADIYEAIETADAVQNEAISAARKLERVRQVFEGVGVAIDVISIASDSYKFVADVNDLASADDPVAVATSAAEAAVGLASVYKATIEIANVLKTRVSNGKVLNDWAKSSFSKVFTKFTSPAFFLQSVASGVDIGVALEKWLYNLAREWHLKEIGGNFLRERESTHNLRMVQVGEAIRMHLKSNAERSVLSREVINDFWDDYSPSRFEHISMTTNQDGETVSFPGGIPRSVSLRNIFDRQVERVFGLSSFNDLPSDQRLGLMLSTLAEMSFYEDLEIKLTLEKIYSNNEGIARRISNFVFGNDDRTAITDIYLTLFPWYLPDGNGMRAQEYYETIYFSYAEAEAGSAWIDGYASLGSVTSNFETVPDVAPNIVWPPLPAVADVSASAGQFRDKVEVRWSWLAGATSYVVYRCGREIINDDCLIRPVPGAGAISYDDFAVEGGVVYWYAVQACSSVRRSCGDIGGLHRGGGCGCSCTVSTSHTAHTAHTACIHTYRPYAVSFTTCR